MDAPSILRCDSKQFQKIYQDLLQLGAPNHERIILRIEGQQNLPATTKKGLFDFNNLDEKSKGKVLEFLENHLDRLVEQEHAHHLFLKLEPFFEGEQKLHFNQIHQLFFKTMALQQMENARLAMVKNEEQHLQEIESQRLKEIETRAHEKESELLKEIQTRANAAETCVKKTEVSIKELENNLALLKKENEDLEDTILVCRDGELHWHMKFLEKVCFFKVYKHNQQKGMKKTLLSSEEEKRYAYKFEFKDFNSKTLDIFTQWLISPNFLNQVVHFDELCELYRLADYLNDISFQSDCLTQINKYLNDDHVLYILSSTEYSTEDSLIQSCCNFVVKNFKYLATHPKFYEIQSEYLAHILKSDYLHVDDEEKILNVLITWAEAQSKKKQSTLAEELCTQVHGQRILDTIRFDNMDKEQFISHVLPLKLLTVDEANHWLTCYLKNEPASHPRFYALQCNSKENVKTKITWNIPLRDYHSMGEWNAQAIIRKKFKINDCKWEIHMGRESNNVIIGIVVHDPKANFDFFLEINKIQYYSKPSKQEAEQLFENNGRDEHSYIRGVYYKAKSLEDNMDIAQHCLPLKIKIFVK